MYHLPCNIRRITACQIYISRCELTGLPRPFHRYILAEYGYFFRRKEDTINGVQIGPGATAFTRIPLSARDRDRDLVKATMAPLVAE